MAIKWMKKTDEKGTATFLNSYVVINKMFAEKFANNYSALLGVDENNNVLFKPLTLDEAESPKYKDSLLLKINVFDSFVRLGNTANMKTISEILHQNFDKVGNKYETYWNDEEHALVVETGGK